MAALKITLKGLSLQQDLHGREGGGGGGVKLSFYCALHMRAYAQPRSQGFSFRFLKGKVLGTRLTHTHDDTENSPISIY